jgi:hypothetical protein
MFAWLPTIVLLGTPYHYRIRITVIEKFIITTDTTRLDDIKTFWHAYLDRLIFEWQAMIALVSPQAFLLAH